MALGTVFWTLLAGATVLCAGPTLEITGHVIERGLRIPVPDATVRLWQYPTAPDVRPEFYDGTALLETQTDAAGQFHFTVPDAGRFRIAAAKTGYGPYGFIMGRISSIASFAVGAGQQEPPLELFLARPGMLTGRLVNADTQQPLTKRTLMARQVWFTDGERHLGVGGMAITGSDGEFAFRNLTPGVDYLVTTFPIISVRRRMGEFRSDSGEIAWQPTWWPGGHDVNTSTPVRVIANTSFNLGTLELRKTSAYEARVTVNPESCLGKTTLTSRIGTASSGYQVLEGIRCGEEFVISGLFPGTTFLHLSTIGDLPAGRLRATAPVVVGLENVKVSISLALGHFVEGRTLVGSQVPTPVPAFSVRLFPPGDLPLADRAAIEVNPNGNFRLLNLAPGQYRLAIDNLPPGYCVEEIRHNTNILRGSTVTIDPYSQTQSLTITLSNKPSTITGRVLKGDKPLPEAHVRAIAYPLPDGPRRNWTVLQTEADPNGYFTFTNLPSGEYRLIAVAAADRYTLEEPNILESLAASAENVDLQPSTAPNITLKSTPAKLTY